MREKQTNVYRAFSEHDFSLLLCGDVVDAVNEKFAKWNMTASLGFLTCTTQW